MAAESPAPAWAPIAAVIVSWRTGPRLFACLEAALAAPDLAEIVLVDNGNPPDVAARLDALARASAKLVLLRGQGNVGFARGCNMGAAQARAERLLFLNPDAVIAPGAAALLARAIEDRPRPAIAGGCVCGLDGREQRGARRRRVTLWGAFVEMSGLVALARLSPVFAPVHLESEPPPAGPVETGVVSGAMLLARAADFAALGGFDEGYFLHVEDVDLCRRAWEAGGAVVYVPDARAVHEGATSAASPLRVAWHKGLSFARYFRKFARGPGRLAAWLLTPVVIAAALVQGVVRLARRLPRAAWARVRAPVVARRR